MNPDELYRMLFAQNAGGLDIGGIERGTFNNAKDFEKMLTGLMASMNPGSVDPKAFQPTVSYGDPVNLPSRALFDQSMLDPASEEAAIATLVNGNTQPSGVYEQMMMKAEADLGMERGSMDKDTRKRVEASASEAKAYASKLWDEQRTWAQTTSQLSPEARAAADAGEATYRPRVEEESAASKEYTSKGLPTPVDQWQMSDFGRGNDGTNEMMQSMARERFESLAAAPKTDDTTSQPRSKYASMPAPTFDSPDPNEEFVGTDTDRYFAEQGIANPNGESKYKIRGEEKPRSTLPEREYWESKSGLAEVFAKSQKESAARAEAVRKNARHTAGDELVATNRNRASQESMSRFQRDQLAQQGITPFVAAMQAAMGGAGPRRKPTTMMSFNDFAGYQDSPKR